MRAVRFTRISNWWTLALLILVVLASKLPGFAQAKKPNIIILMTDDVGWMDRSEEHTSELQSLRHLVCRLLLEKKKTKKQATPSHTKTPSRTQDDSHAQTD